MSWGGGSLRAKAFLTVTRNEARLVFPQRDWGPKYPTSRGLIVSAFRLCRPIEWHAETPSSYFLQNLTLQSFDGFENAVSNRLDPEI